MTELLDREIDVDVVFAVNDVMAVGATAALRDQRYHVTGGHVRRGLRRHLDSARVRRALTTVRLPLVEINRRALDLALNHALRGEDDSPPVVVTVLGEVVVRDSTPPRIADESTGR